MIDPVLSNFRGSATVDGSKFWAAANPGVRYFGALGSNVTTTVQSTVSMRTATLFNHPLDGPSLWLGSANTFALAGAPASLVTGAVTPTALTLPSIGASMNAFWFADSNTLWAGDDARGLFKWVATYGSPTNADMIYAVWTLVPSYPVIPDLANGYGMKAITGRWETEDVAIYATTSSPTGNSLLRLWEKTGVWTLLYTTDNGGQLRAIFAPPLPIPASATATATPTATLSQSLSGSITVTSSQTPSITPSPTASTTAPPSFTATISLGATPSSTASRTMTPTNTGSTSGTGTSSPTASPSGTSSASTTPSPSGTGTRNSFFSTSLIALRVGDGSAPLSSNGNPVFLEEWTTSGSLLRTIAVNPNTNSYGGGCQVSSGASEGAITRTWDGKRVLLPCFSGVTTNYVVGLVSADLSIDTTTLFSDAGGPVRSCASMDGSQIYFASKVYTRLISYGASTSTQIVASNIRHLAFYNMHGTMQLFAGAQASPGNAVSFIGTGLPTTAAPQTALIGTTGYTNGQQFLFQNPQVLWLADNNAGLRYLTTTMAEGAGSPLATWVEAAWSPLNPTNGTSLGARNIVAKWEGPGNDYIIYLTTAAAFPQYLYRLNTTGAPNVRWTFMASVKNANQQWFGLTLAPCDNAINGPCPSPSAAPSAYPTPSTSHSATPSTTPSHTPTPSRTPSHTPSNTASGSSSASASSSASYNGALGCRMSGGNDCGGNPCVVRRAAVALEVAPLSHIRCPST